MELANSYNTTLDTKKRIRTRLKVRVGELNKYGEDTQIIRDMKKTIEEINELEEQGEKEKNNSEKKENQQNNENKTKNKGIDDLFEVDGNIMQKNDEFFEKSADYNALRNCTVEEKCQAIQKINNEYFEYIMACDPVLKVKEELLKKENLPIEALKVLSKEKDSKIRERCSKTPKYSSRNIRRAFH